MSAAGWYVGRIETSSVATAKAGTSPEIQDTVFQWTSAGSGPTVATANITGLTAIVGGPYPTQAAAQAVAQGDPNTTSGLPGVGAPGVSASTVNSSNGAIGNPLGFLGNLANFFGDFTQAATWIRVAKVIIGGVLLITGAAHLTGTDKTAAKALKAAPLLAA